MNDSKRQQARTQGRFDHGKSDPNNKQKNGSGRQSGSDVFFSESLGGENDTSTAFPGLVKQPIVEEIKDPGIRVLSSSRRGESSIFFEPDFIPLPKAKELFKTLYENVDWGSKKIVINGDEIPQPRLVAWFGPLPYTYSGLTLKSKVMPDAILEIKRNVEHILRKEGIEVELNSVLLNLYRDEKDSVAWHSDDEISMGICPTIASVSLGQMRRFQLRKKTGDKYADPEFVVHLTNGSLIVMDGVMQEDWEHRVPKEYHQRQKRINLTFRTVYAIDDVQRPLAVVSSFADKKPVPYKFQESFHYKEEAFPSLGGNTVPEKLTQKKQTARYAEDLPASPSVRKKNNFPYQNSKGLDAKCMEGYVKDDKDSSIIDGFWDSCDDPKSSWDEPYCDQELPLKRSDKDFSEENENYEKKSKKTHTVSEPLEGDYCDYRNDIQRPSSQQNYNKGYGMSRKKSEKIESSYKSSKKSYSNDNGAGEVYHEEKKSFSSTKRYSYRNKNHENSQHSNKKDNKPDEESKFKQSRDHSSKQLPRNDKNVVNEHHNNDYYGSSNEHYNCESHENSQYHENKTFTSSKSRNGSNKREHLRSCDNSEACDYESKGHEEAQEAGYKNRSFRNKFPSGSGNRQRGNSFRSSNKQFGHKDYSGEPESISASTAISKENVEYDHRKTKSTANLPDSKTNKEVQIVKQEQSEENINMDAVDLELYNGEKYENPEYKGSVMSADAPEFHSKIFATASTYSCNYSSADFDENYRIECTKLEEIYSHVRQNEYTLPFSKRDSEELKVLSIVIDCSSGPLPLKVMVAIRKRLEAILYYMKNRSYNGYSTAPGQRLYHNKNYRRDSP